MKKIKVFIARQLHYLAGCQSCNWTAGRNTTETPEPKDVRNAARRHVRKTSHTIWIETGNHTTYSLEDEYK